MKILVTGSRGFVGRNLIESLKAIKEGKNKTRPKLSITEIFQYDRDTDPAFLEESCKNADFVFHLAGVNRPESPSEFMEGNYGPASELLRLLKKHHNPCPVMLSSSIQASLVGRYEGSEYGKSKLAGEKLFREYGRETGARVLIYRFPNLFGKWCRPNYNSVVATFCHGVANGLECRVHDRNTELELVYIDDLVEEMLNGLEGHEHRCEYEGLNGKEKADGAYCFVPVSEKKTLGEILDLLKGFHATPETFEIPVLLPGSFVKKLYSTYLSYLPEEGVCYPLKKKEDGRGIFAEMVKTPNCGQVSINIIRPGQVRGEHWHHSKWEMFLVVSGHGLVQERRMGTDEKGEAYPVMEFEVTGEQLRVVRMLPGYTHNIANRSLVEDLVMVIWANEVFNPSFPDTYYERVEH